MLKHSNVLAKVNKFPYERLINMMPHDAHYIKIHVRTMTISDLVTNNMSKILLSNNNNITAHNVILVLFA